MTDVRAVIIASFGDEPHLATFPVPELAADQVLIEVEAASVNAFDWKAAEGRFKDSFEYEFPVTIGRDYAGVVSAVGSAVRRVAPGDKVFGYFTGQTLHRGSYATHVWAAESECFVRRPAGLDPVVAATLPLAGVVALRAVDAVKPGPAERVLVLGAPGGVGSIVVQLAARAGAHVIASGLAEDDAYLRHLGAAEVIAPGDRLASEVRQRYPDGIDCLIDLVSYRPAFLAHAGLLAAGGRAASVHRAVDEATFADRGLIGANIGSFPDQALLGRLADLAVSGDLTVAITGRYSLEEAPRALAVARDQHTRGKIVLELKRQPALENSHPRLTTPSRAPTKVKTRGKEPRPAPSAGAPKAARTGKGDDRHGTSREREQGVRAGAHGHGVPSARARLHGPHRGPGRGPRRQLTAVGAVRTSRPRNPAGPGFLGLACPRPLFTRAWIMLQRPGGSVAALTRR